MRVLIQILIPVVLAPLFAPATLRAQTAIEESGQTFRSSADLVSIQTSVRDKRGRPLTGLTTADFEVRDNGQLKPILSLRSDRRSPVSVAVLVDTSGSMRVGSKMSMARQAFDTLLRLLREGEDEIALFTFDSSLHERQSFTTRFSDLEDELDDFPSFGATSLYDATAATARQLAARSAGHKAIIIFTDGVDTSSKLTAPEVSGLASSIDVPVYIVATVPAVDQFAMTQADDRASAANGADLRHLAEWTGGRLAFASSPLDTVVVTSSLLDELRQQYVLAIQAASVQEWRRIQVRVKHPSATVKARSGYFGG
jgi:VWFA-related protein